MFFVDRFFFQDEKAATVVFGTLMIILVTIVVVSGLAFAASQTLKDNQERQAMQDAAKNENLKIVTIKPSSCYDPSNWNYDPSCWDNISFTVLNLDILDAKIATISINGNYLMNYFLLDENGNPFFIGNTSYPVFYNYSNKVDIPTGRALKIFFGNIYTQEEITAASSVTLNNCPSRVYSDGYRRSVIIRDSTNNTFAESASNFTLDDNTSTLTIYSSSISGACTVEYRTLPDLTTMQVSKGDPITVEIISDRTNLFSKRFMPPTPVADAQSKTDTYGNYLVLDGSKSNDLDGFITDYRWDISINSNATPLSPVTKHGNTLQVRPPYDTNVSIDLTVTNNYGMFTKLSDVSGNITIP